MTSAYPRGGTQILVCHLTFGCCATISAERRTSPLQNASTSCRRSSNKQDLPGTLIFDLARHGGQFGGVKSRALAASSLPASARLPGFREAAQAKGFFMNL